MTSPTVPTDAGPAEPAASDADMQWLEELDQAFWTIREFATLHHGDKNNIAIMAEKCLNEVRRRGRALALASSPAVAPAGKWMPEKRERELLCEIRNRMHFFGLSDEWQDSARALLLKLENIAAPVREAAPDAPREESYPPMPVGYQKLVGGKWEHCTAFMALGFNGQLGENYREVYASPVVVAPDAREPTIAELEKRLRDEQEAHAQLQARCYEGFASASDGIFDHVKEMRAAIKIAYGHLWHVNNEPAAPIRLYSVEDAAYAARKALRELLTSNERGTAIVTVGAEIGRYPDSAAQDAAPEAKNSDWVNDLLRAWNDTYPRMNIRSAPGTTVVFDGRGGYDSEKEHAAKKLTLRGLYTVESVNIGGSSSTVKLVGIPGVWNTCLFSAAPLPASGTQQGDAEFVRMLLWDEFPECCGSPVVGAEHMGQQEEVCCGNPEPALLNDKQIVASLRERFPQPLPAPPTAPKG